MTTDVYISGSEDLKAQLAYTLVISPDAQADVTWNLAWKAADATVHEAGLKFLLPAAADRMSWSADSRWTEYPAGHVAGPLGSASVQDAAFGAQRRDVHWMSFSGAGNYIVIALTAGKPLHTRERNENNQTTLFLNSAVGAAARDSAGEDVRLTQASPLTGAFRLRVASNTR